MAPHVAHVPQLVGPSTLQVFNLTSKSTDRQMVQLSPFYCHGGIPVPGLPGREATSVERIWQGLKVFEQAGEDLAALDRPGMSGIKRTVRKNGEVGVHQGKFTLLGAWPTSVHGA